MKSVAELETIRENLKIASGYCCAIEENDVKVAIRVSDNGVAEARKLIKTFMTDIEKLRLEHVKVVLIGSVEAIDGEPVVEVTAPGKDKVTFKNVNPDKAHEIIASINNK